jgi:hypothetical protein
MQRSRPYCAPQISQHAETAPNRPNKSHKMQRSRPYCAPQISQHAETAPNRPNKSHKMQRSRPYCAPQISQNAEIAPILCPSRATSASLAIQRLRSFCAHPVSQPFRPSCRTETVPLLRAPSLTPLSAFLRPTARLMCYLDVSPPSQQRVPPAIFIPLLRTKGAITVPSMSQSDRFSRYC